MPYITNYRKKLIVDALFACNISMDITNEELKGIYEYPIHTLHILDDKEQERLAQIKKLFQNLVIYINAIHGKVEIKDTRKYTEKEKKRPSFHLYINCCWGNKDFNSTVIPPEVPDRDVDKFRELYQQIKHLDFPSFVEQLLNEFPYIKNPKLIHEHKENSGLIPFRNIDIKDTENKIDNLIKKIEFFQKETKDMTSQDVETHVAYKEELKTLLVDYYSVRLNPDLILQEKLLGTLGFKQCSECGINYALECAKIHRREMWGL